MSKLQNCDALAHTIVTVVEAHYRGKLLIVDRRCFCALPRYHSTQFAARSAIRGFRPGRCALPPTTGAAIAPIENTY